MRFGQISGPDSDRASLGELLQGDLFHRTPVQAASQTSVLHNVAAAHIDTVMGVTATWCNDVRTQRRFLTRVQQPVAFPWRAVVEPAVFTSFGLQDVATIIRLPSGVTRDQNRCADAEVNLKHG